MQRATPKCAGGEVEAQPVPTLKLSHGPDDRPAGRCAVPRDAAEVPGTLAANYVEAKGDGRVRKIREQYFAEFLQELDFRAMDGSLAIDAQAAGALFGLSERAWRRLDVTGQVPAPVHIGRNVRWRLSELARWARRGCPDRDTWNSIRRR